MVSMMTRLQQPAVRPAEKICAPSAFQGPHPVPTRTPAVTSRLVEQRQSSAQKAAPPSVQQTSADVQRRKEWMAFLRENCLLQLADVLLRNGFDDLETLAEMEDADMKDLGFSAPDAVRLRRSIQHLRGVPETDENHPVVAFLRESGLQQYAETLLANGFDDMETLLEIQDGDMRDLGLPRGHAIKLAKRLREFQSPAPEALASLPPPSWSPALPAPAPAPAPTTRAPPAGRRFMKGPQTTDEQKSAVERSWERVQLLGSDAIGEKLYKHVFQIAPETMEIFPPEVRYKYREWSADEGFADEGDLFQSPALRKLFAKVVNAVGVSVAGLRRPESMVPMLIQLGARHISYGVDEKWWAVLGEGLILILQECLGDDFTPEVQTAWTMVYGFISAVMIQGLKGAIAARNAAALGDGGQNSHTASRMTDDRSSVSSHSEPSQCPEHDSACPEKGL